MKSLINFTGAPASASLYTPTVPASGIFQNRNVNPLGSKYAQQYGHGTTSIISRVVRQMIYDAAPQQYFDLKILGLKAPQQRNSDEIFYHEIGFGRDPIVLDTIAAPIPAAKTHTYPVLNIGSVSLDMIVIIGDTARGTVTNINTANNTIQVTAETNNILPLMPAAASGTVTLANHSPVEADGANSISQYWRIDTIERCNYIQMLVKAQRWGKMEHEKYKRASSLDSYLAWQRKRMQDQFRIDRSNVYWNGRMAEVTLANGQKAKTAGGVFPIMQQVGSANATTSMANLPQALEELALDTEYSAYGKTRFAYATPRLIHYLCQQYKRQLTRYTPNDDIAKLELKGVNMGSTNIVFVPIKRFEEPSCFPPSWRSRLILLDQESIQPVYFFPEEMGDTLSRVNNGTLQNYVDMWMSTTFSIEYSNPLGGGWINVNDLP